MGRAYAEWAKAKQAQASRGSWRTRPGGIDPQTLRERGGLPGYGDTNAWENRFNPNLSRTQSLWEAAAHGMGLGNVGSNEDYDRLMAAYQGTNMADFDSYDDVQGMIAWDQANQGGGGNPAAAAGWTGASTPERPGGGGGGGAGELDTGEDQWSQMMMMMMMMNMMEANKPMPEPEKPTNMITSGAQSGSSPHGARAKNSTAFKSGAKSKGTNVWGRDSMKIGTLNMA